MQQILDMFRGESGGKLSWMRCASTVVVGIVLVVYIAHNVVSMSKGNGYITMSWQDVTMILGVLGVKAAQTYGERSTSSTPETTNALPTGKTE